ncbi:unnamed protein product [Ilex paraguariensis]|uniref:Uncharacterized protein n=1 Tax=Ilex paraguariensis TaxID=185542 RepID=A0ABC8U4C9_9AQUA
MTATPCKHQQSPDRTPKKPFKTSKIRRHIEKTYNDLLECPDRRERKEEDSREPSERSTEPFRTATPVSTLTDRTGKIVLARHRMKSKIQNHRSFVVAETKEFVAVAIGVGIVGRMGLRTVVYRSRWRMKARIECRRRGGGWGAESKGGLSSEHCCFLVPAHREVESSERPGELGIGNWDLGFGTLG